MKTTILAAAVAAVAIPSLASAQDFEFVYDPSDGTVVVDANGFSIGGFTLNSASGALDPTGLPNGGGDILLSFSPIVVLSALTETADTISFGSLTADITPELFDGFELGAIITPGTELSDLSLTAIDTTGLGSVPAAVVLVPEPATAGLMGIASLGLLRRRRA
ncbi:MAG: PEP-CTERM sorting domain-containing protein [Planctomycetota bacterium]